MSSLKNKICLITGASSGIGKACAFGFAREGANLIINSRDKKVLNKIANELKSNYKIDVLPLAFDIKNYELVKQNISTINNSWNKIDFLINNAGLAKGFDKIYEGKIENWDDTIDTNLKGLLYVTREVLSLMLKNKKGHIINIGSIAGHEVYQNGNVYCATKFAVDAITKSLRLELLDKKIKVSTVDPGMVETNFSNVRFLGDEERAKNVYKGLKPLTADDIADAVLFCATRPQHVNINQVVLTPLNQANVNNIIRE